MLGIFKKIKSAVSYRSTYKVGLLQAKAYRNLKRYTGELLLPFGISTIEWAFLGLLYDHKLLRSGIAAEELGVETPFITAMVTSLKKQGLVEDKRDPSDSRAKQLKLTSKGNLFVEKVETTIRGAFRPVIQGISPSDFIGYFATLEKIIENIDKKS